MKREPPSHRLHKFPLHNNRLHRQNLRLRRHNLRLHRPNRLHRPQPFKLHRLLQYLRSQSGFFSLPSAASTTTIASALIVDSSTSLPKPVLDSIPTIPSDLILTIPAALPHKDVLPFSNKDIASNLGDLPSGSESISVSATSVTPIDTFYYTTSNELLQVPKQVHDYAVFNRDPS